MAHPRAQAKSVSHPGQWRERGGALAGFVMIAPLLIGVVLALMGIAGTLYVRTLMLDAAAEAARYGSQSGAGPRAAEARAHDLIDSSFASSFTREIRAEQTILDGVPVIEVEVRADAFGLATVEVRAHAPVE
ncbi:MAG: hypothetical protein Q3979_01340 [Actinomycetaceae bacterium]|nr:hypothetical protein [Actinomycetaceae bacterium]